jgi:hypothetical protein
MILAYAFLGLILFESKARQMFKVSANSVRMILDFYFSNIHTYSILWTKDTYLCNLLTKTPLLMVTVLVGLPDNWVGASKIPPIGVVLIPHP